MRHVTLEDATAALRSQRTAACTACNHAGAAAAGGCRRGLELGEADRLVSGRAQVQAGAAANTHKQTNKQTNREMRTVVRTDSLLCGGMCDGRSVRVARMRVRCMLSRVVWYPQCATCRMGPIRSGTSCPRRRRSTRTRTRPTCAFTFARLTWRTSLIRLDTYSGSLTAALTAYLLAKSAHAQISVPRLSECATCATCADALEMHRAMCRNRRKSSMVCA
jgi:hypothetical protein